MPFVIHKAHSGVHAKDVTQGVTQEEDLAIPEKAGTGLESGNFQCHLQATGAGKVAEVQSPIASILI